MKNNNKNHTQKHTYFSKLPQVSFQPGPLPPVLEHQFLFLYFSQLSPSLSTKFLLHFPKNKIGNFYVLRYAIKINSVPGLDNSG